MRKIFGLSGAALFFITLFTVNSCNNASDKKASIYKAQDSINARISRGAYLVNAICNCMHCQTWISPDLQVLLLKALREKAAKKLAGESM
jgi:hypothetical protein